jgi:hypothetical protein
MSINPMPQMMKISAYQQVVFSSQDASFRCFLGWRKQKARGSISPIRKELLLILVLLLRSRNLFSISQST